MRTRKGFATIIALILLSLTTAALAATAVLCTSVVRRAAVERSAAQSRQLQLAAMIDLTTRAKTWPAAAPVSSYTLAVPTGGVTVSIRPTPGGAAASVTVEVDGHRWATVTLWKRIDDAWRLE